MTGASADGWRTLNVGAGGWLTGIDVALDNTRVVRTDTYGAYLWDGARWRQLVTESSMPGAELNPANGGGVYEIRIAQTDSNILYMHYSGSVYRSEDKGLSWAKTALPSIVVDPNDAYRMYGQKMAIHPTDPNIVVVGTSADGIFLTTDGGKTWGSPSLPVSKPDASGIRPGITGIAFDPQQTNTIYASSYGNGVFISGDGGATWKLSGKGPLEVEYAVVSGGDYYAIGGDNSLWRFDGAWKKILTYADNKLHSVAIDPFDPEHIVVADGAGRLNQSHDGGLTWSGENFGTELTASDIPWLSTSGNYMSVGGLVFDQVQPDRLWMSGGVGVWNTVVPEELTWSTPVVWQSQSVGIEQLVANEIIVPPGGQPLVASWDRPVFRIEDPDRFPSEPGISGFSMGWSVDYATTDPKYIAIVADYWGVENSGFSVDGGRTWTPFSGLPTDALNSIGGTIAASSPQNLIWAPANKYAPNYTLDGGKTWTPVSLPDVSNWDEFHFAYYLERTTVVADRVVENTFYLYNKGVYRTTDGGVHWQKVYDTEISPFSGFNAKIGAVPGNAGHLFFTGGHQSGTDPAPQQFFNSQDGGVTWQAVPDVLEVHCFGFGKSAVTDGFPAIFIVGWVKGVYGVWQSDDEAQSWRQIGKWPNGSLDTIKTISGDPNIYGQVYVGFGGSGYAYLPGVSASVPDDGSISPDIHETDGGVAPQIPVDTIAPSAPLITGYSPDIDLHNNINTSKIKIVGEAEPGSLVKVYEGDAFILAVRADISGKWSVVTDRLVHGKHIFAANATDGAGNVSVLSATTAVDIAHTAPSITAFSSSKAGQSGNESKAASYIELSGIAEPDQIVSIFESLKPLGSVQASSSGAWTFTTRKLVDGEHHFQLMGSNGLISQVYDLIVDSSRPPPPTISEFRTSANLIADAISSNSDLTIHGDAEAGTSVFVYDNAKLLGTVIANGEGRWSYGALLPEGAHNFAAVSLDAAGNRSATSSISKLKVDTVAPAAPTVARYSQQTETGHNAHDAALLTLSGVAEVNSKVKVYDDGDLIGETIANSKGVWSLPYKTVIGDHAFSGSATDAASNTSKMSSQLIADIDRVEACASHMSHTLNKLGLMSLTKLIGIDAADFDSNARNHSDHISHSLDKLGLMGLAKLIGIDAADSDSSARHHSDQQKIAPGALSGDVKAFEIDATENRGSATIAQSTAGVGNDTASGIKSVWLNAADSTNRNETKPLSDVGTMADKLEGVLPASGDTPITDATPDLDGFAMSPEAPLDLRQFEATGDLGPHKAALENLRALESVADIMNNIGAMAADTPHGDLFSDVFKLWHADLDSR